MIPSWKGKTVSSSLLRPKESQPKEGGIYFDSISESLSHSHLALCFWTYCVADHHGCRNMWQRTAVHILVNRAESKLKISQR